MAGIKFNVRPTSSATSELTSGPQRRTPQPKIKVGTPLIAGKGKDSRSGSPLVKILIPLWLLALLFVWIAKQHSAGGNEFDLADNSLQAAYQVYYRRCTTPHHSPVERGVPSTCPSISLPQPETLSRDLERIAILRNQGERERLLEETRQLLSRLDNDERNPVVLALRKVAQ